MRITRTGMRSFPDSASAAHERIRTQPGNPGYLTRYPGRCLVIALLALWALVATAAESPEAVTLDPVAAGKRIYLEGVLSDGTPLSKVVSRNQPDGDVACVRCHRRSGLGGMEGGELVPAITGDYLFRNHLKVVTEPAPRRIKRWAYTENAFKRALQNGIDVMGDPISTAMPRYALAQPDIQALMAYLHTLSHAKSPGIDEQTVHIATVVDRRLPQAEREALIQTASRYVDHENRVIQAQEKRAAFSNRQNNWNVKSFRRWKWHLWELDGDPESWPEQLQTHYEQQPVFLLVGGAVSGPWSPIDRFCEARALPCLFPHTNMPAQGERSYFTFYYSRGLELEANVLVTHLSRKTVRPERILQIAPDNQTGRYATESLDLALAGSTISTETRHFNDIEGLKSIAADALGSHRDLMLWLNDEELRVFREILGTHPSNAQLYQSSSLLSQPLDPSGGTGEEAITLIHPFTLPWQESDGQSEGFLSKHGILDKRYYRLQSETFTAFATLGQVLKRIKHNLVREYFMEQLESLSENLRVTSLYPRFSLGPYQRTVSKGAYILPLSVVTDPARDVKQTWVIPSL
ncbi:MAG: hypothetical protein ABW101_15990 [Candidatus Thiodiazotropha sp.]